MSIVLHNMYNSIQFQMSCDPFVIISKSDAVNGLIGSIQLTKLLNFVAQPNYTFTLQATVFNLNFYNLSLTMICKLIASS